MGNLLGRIKYFSYIYIYHVELIISCFLVKLKKLSEMRKRNEELEHQQLKSLPADAAKEIKQMKALVVRCIIMFGTFLFFQPSS